MTSVLSPTISEAEVSKIIDTARLEGGHSPSLGALPLINDLMRRAIRIACVRGADDELAACMDALDSTGYADLPERLYEERRPAMRTPRQKARRALGLAMAEAGKSGKIFDGEPFFELQKLIEGLPDTLPDESCTTGTEPYETSNE
jgi:hypothetical protein